MISSDVVVLTKTELEEKERAAFRRGVERGRFEERMDVNARPASGEREEYRKAVDDLNKLTDADLRRGKPAPSPAPAEELVKNLRKLNVCRRCDCSDCEREGAGELHDHVCTNGPGCVDTVPKLRRWRRGAVILAGQAAAEIRRLTEEGHNARETSRLLLIQRDEANTRAEQAERERDEACKKTSLSDKLAFNNSERAAHYQAALAASEARNKELREALAGMLAVHDLCHTPPDASPDTLAELDTRIDRARAVLAQIREG